MKTLRNLESGLPECPHLAYRTVGDHIHAEVKRRWPDVAACTYSVRDMDGKAICGHVVPDAARHRFVLLDHLRAPGAASAAVTNT